MIVANASLSAIKPSTQRRCDSTRQLRRVGGVYWALSRQFLGPVYFWLARRR